MSKKVFLITLSVMLLCSLLLGITLKGNSDFEFLALHTNPVCGNDLVVFRDSVCASCGQTVEKTGLFRSVDEDTSTVMFRDRYKNWKDYKGKITKNKILSGSFIVLGIAEIVLIWFYFYKKKQTDDKNNEDSHNGDKDIQSDVEDKEVG